MREIIRGAIVALTMMVTATIAFAAWDIDKMNSHIDDTNWIVDEICSGTTLDAANRLIITNYHCVKESYDRYNGQNLKKGDLFLSQRIYDDYSVVKEIKYSAKIIAMEPRLDLAILQIRDETAVLTGELKFAPDTYKVKRGEKVFIVGNPTGQDGTLVVGYVSSLARTIFMNPQVSFQYFQVSGGLAGGVSGGSVYNESGEFIGIPSAATPAANFIGFVTPLSVIKKWLISSGLPVK